MTDNKLSTESYKGVRDFYPEDAAIQQYIFNTWAKTAESFGFERYDASILEPSALYKAKGAENEEMVNEQTYTFTDRGEREVTLRPEMTPTVARMVAGKRHELTFPLRWYSIPNLFRYERPQRGRLREFWQLNCDIFGGDKLSADVEMITLSYQTIINFGATPDQFEIQINDRQEMAALYAEISITDTNIINSITRLNDRKKKIDPEQYRASLNEILSDETLTNKVIALVESTEDSNPVLEGLRSLGITNAKIDRTIARGFDYYTGTIFELVDLHPDNNRAMMGGGRFDNLTGLFSGDAISGIGFGMGDVPMQNFLESHNLLPEHIKTTAAVVSIIPMSVEQNLFAQGVAQQIRQSGHSVSTNIGSKKVGDKIKQASENGSQYVIVIGEDEMASGKLTIKRLSNGEGSTGSIKDILRVI